MELILQSETVFDAKPQTGHGKTVQSHLSQILMESTSENPKHGKQIGLLA
jgi:hypothetical protein